MNELFRWASAPGRDIPQITSKGVPPGPLVRGKYVHWNDLVYREPPEGMDHTEWWFMLKLSRQGTRTIVPLRDPGHERFSFTLVDPIPGQLHEIDMQAGGRIGMFDQITNPELRDQYYVGSLIEEAITSSQLEGATTTRRVAKDMLRTGRAPRDRSEQMILNNFLTMKRIGALRETPLTPDLVFEIHRMVTESTLDDPTAAGRFRHADEHIIVSDRIDGTVMHEPPPANTLDQRIRAMCEFANIVEHAHGQVFIHPVVRSIILHFWLAYDHPFVDGNGRTARALFYWSMLRHGYWLAEFMSISQIILKGPSQYAKAFLHTETDDNDLTYFILYHLRVVRRALTTLVAYIARKTEDVRQLEAGLRGIEVLNHRQRALIRDAVRRPGRWYTVNEHRRSHGVVYETARTDLLDLRERDLLRAERQGRKWVFSPVPNLPERLAALAPGRGRPRRTQAPASN